MKKAVIVDIDGVVLDCPGWTNMEDFYNHLDKCTPKYEIVILVNALHNIGIDIIFLTARGEKYESITRKQLQKIFNFSINLKMRKLTDLREDYLIKEDYVKTLMKDYHILLAIDDNIKNCDMFESYDITTLRIKNKTL